MEKIHQTNKFLEQEQKGIAFKITEFEKIHIWELKVKDKGPPIATYYESWNKLRNIKKSKQATENEKIGDYNLPTIKKVRKDTKKEILGPANPFPSDDDSETEVAQQKNKGNVINNSKKIKRVKRKNTAAIKIEQDDGDNDVDVVEDLNINDW